MRLSILLLAWIGCADSGRDGSSGTSTTGGKPGDTHDMAGVGNVIDDLAVDRDAFFINDPPPKYCGADGGFTPPTPPGGTLQCPDDKNLEGCPCSTLGMTASCWPGLRANRHLGICMDGMTTCQQSGEVGQAWGPCMGAVTPTAGVSDGASACKCFSHGLWAIDNSVPCLGMSTAFSSSDPSGKNPACPAPPAAGTSWSTDSVTADCAGTFTLCYTLKAGDATKPNASDCTIAQSCTTGNYTQVGMAQPFPPLPSWTSNNATCIQQFTNTGGYGEMSVHGTTLTCDMITNHVFQRTSYCKATCMPGSTDPACANCGNGGMGGF